MQRKMWIRLLGVGIFAGLGIGLLTGCEEEKDIDYTIEGVTEENQVKGSEGKSGMAQFRDNTQWEAEWQVPAEKLEWGTSVVDVVVDARITLPEVEYMSVIEVEEPEFDTEYKEQIAKRFKRLFDNEEIYYGFTDICYIPKTELEKRIRECEEGLAAAKEMGMSQEEKESYVSELESNKEAYEANLENAKQGYTPVDEYTEDEYIGNYKRKSYKLNFWVNGANDFNIRRTKEIVFEPENLHDVCPDEVQEIKYPVCTSWMRGDLIENQAEISEDEALKLAQSFAEKLGMEYSVLSYSCPLVWGDATISNDSTNDWIANGYVFSFDFGIDDISFVEYGIEKDYDNLWTSENAENEAGELKRYSMETRMQIYVTDKGVIQMSAYNPLETIGISERVELLPLDTIKDIMHEQLDTHYSDFQFFLSSDKIWFDRMELIYFRVADKENPGRYSYVPAWRPSNLTEDKVLHARTIRNPVLINAIDGSVIDICNEK